ncbi:MAG: nitrate/nitrite transporter NrtS [Myxococcota bacterium]
MANDARSWLALALSWPVVRRALGYAVVVGAILIAINHGDALLRGEWTANRLWKMGLTPLVPYLVSTLSSVGALRASEKPAA